MRTYKTIQKNGRQVRVRTDGPPLIAADGTRCYKFAGGHYASDHFAKLTVSTKGNTMQKIDPSIHPYTPGEMKYATDDEVQAIVSRGKPSLPIGAIPQSVYETRAQFDEASAEQLKRIKGPTTGAFTAPGRTDVQMQPNPKTPPTMRPARANDALMGTPATLLSDEELAANATAAPDQLPQGEVTSEDYARAQLAREAKREIMRRALSPKTGVRTDPTNWSA